MSIKVNLANVEAWEAGGGILPPGKHVCKIADVEEGTSSGGHPELAVRLEAVGGDHAGSGVRDWIVVTPQSLGRVRQFLEAAGVPIPEGEFEIPSHKLLDRTVTVFVKKGQNNRGEERTEVAAYAPAPTRSEIPADTSGLPTGNGAAKQDETIPF